MTMDLKYLKLLAGQYPTEGKALAEMIRLQGVQRLPKGTELFLSDLHGEDEAFTHILNNASGVIYEKIATALPDLPEEDRRALASLIYYPHEQLARVGEEGPPGGWGRTLRRLLQVARVTAAKYSGRYVRAAMPEDLGYLLEELLSDHDRENRAQYVSGILSAAQEAGSAADLARAELVLFRALQEVVSESERPRDNLDSLPAALEVILKVDRQIERCLRLRLDVARSGAVREAACGNDGIAE